MTKEEAKKYLIETEGVWENDVVEFSDKLVEFRTNVDIGTFDDFKTYPFFFQVDISDENNPVYSEGFISSGGEKHTEKSFIIINEE